MTPLTPATAPDPASGPYGFCAYCGRAKKPDMRYVHDTCLAKVRRQRRASRG